MPLRRDLEVREAPAEAEEWATSANAPSRNAGPPCNEWVEHSARSKSPYYFSSSHSFLQLLAIIFFCSLCSFTFFIYFFFFSSIRTHFAQGSLVAILSLISCIQLILLFFSFFPYTHTHTYTCNYNARYINRSLNRFLSGDLSISHDNSHESFISSFFPVSSSPSPFLFFLSSSRFPVSKETNRGIRGLASFYFFPPPHSIFFSLVTLIAHSLFIAALACSTCVYALLLSQIFIYPFIYFFLILRNRFAIAKNRSYER